MNRYSYVKEYIKGNITSAEYKMQDALISMLLEEKENISVRTLIERADVERSTFYAYFERIEDVVEETENALIADILNISLDEELGTYMENVFSVFAENKKGVKALLEKANRFSFYSKLLDCAKYYLSNKFTKEYSFENDMKEDAVAAAILNPLIRYVTDERDIDLNQMEKKVKEILMIA